MPRLDVNGIKLNVTHLPQSRGQGGTPLLFVHGLAASSAFWYMAGAPLLARLGDCTLYDLRGHGKSGVPDTGFGVTTMANDLLGLMDQMDMERAHLVAHSFGGMIALLAALKAPERVASMILADVRVRPLQQKLELPARKVPARLADRLNKIGVSIQTINNQDDGIDYLKTVAKIQLAAGDEANDLLKEIYHHPQLFRSRKNAEKWIALTERASFVEDLKNGESFAPQDLSRLTQPMLVMYGTKSTTGPSAQAVTRLCPNAILHEIPDVGHFFPMSQPRLFLKPAARFLRAVNAGRTSFPKKM